jgi:hypothetical protein
VRQRIEESKAIIAKSKQVVKESNQSKEEFEKTIKDTWAEMKR